MINNILNWFNNRVKKTKHRDTRLWKFILLSLFIGNLGLTYMITISNPTGLNLIVDFIIYFLLVFIGFSLTTIAIAIILSLFYIPLPRLFIGGTIFTAGLCYYILHKASLGDVFTYVVTGSFIIALILLGIILYIVFHHSINRVVKMMTLVLPISIIIFITVFSPFLHSEIPAFADVYDRATVKPLEDENPAKIGDYSVQYFTYGSGVDKYRKEYGQDVTFISPTVDGSTYIEDWPKKREKFWGFDEKELPLNGRVWMPKEEGIYPIVIITHGNHKMEYFSDAGYGYIGELLASRGFITVSIDQNYLNYSNWSGIPKKDMELRTWIILQHLLQIEEYSEQNNHPFFQKVDFQKITLMGHSRGGLASTMAVDYKKWFKEDPTVQGADKFNVEAVIALSPTDKRTDGKLPSLKDVNYLVIHGAQDADVNSFSGDRQYNRVYFSEGSNKFKSSLYLAGANHSYFNTEWGKKDSSMPGGLFLNHKDTMDKEEQREIAKVYISAFLEATFHGNTSYEKLFQNYQYGLNWLPESFNFNQYKNSRFVPINSFLTSKPKDTFNYDIAVETLGFSNWEIKLVEDRRRNTKGYAAAELEWREEAKYKINLSRQFVDQLRFEPDSFVVSVANLARDLQEEVGNPLIDIEFINDKGESVRIPLDEHMSIPKQVKLQYNKIAWFDEVMRKGKFEEEEEPVFHMYQINLHTLKELNSQMHYENISEIILHFSNGPGKVMINDLGYMSYQ